MKSCSIYLYFLILCRWHLRTANSVPSVTLAGRHPIASRNRFIAGVAVCRMFLVLIKVRIDGQILQVSFDLKGDKG